MDVDYYDVNGINNFVLTRERNEVIDTFKYLHFDEKGLLNIEQYKWDIYCGTGNPHDAEKITYKYNQNNKLVNKLIKRRWSHLCQSELKGVWIDYLKIDYKYIDNNLAEEFHYSILWNEGYDSIKTEMFPIKHVVTDYLENDSIGNKVIEEWDLEKKEWVKKVFNEYNYIDESTYIIHNIWSAETLEWVKKHREKLVYHNDLVDKYAQRWNGNSNTWDEYSKEYYEYSGVSGYFNFYSKYKDNNTWVSRRTVSYRQIGDTIVERYDRGSGSGYEYYFLFDDDKKLLERWNYNLSSGKDLVDHIKNTYNNFGNIIKEEFKSEAFESNPLTNKYYWHSEKNNLDKYVPYVDANNKWNIGYWDDFDKPSHTVVYSFSKDSILKNTKYYYNLMKTNNGNEERTGSYLREENGKVWQFFEEEEKMWYDFTLEVGDTFSIDNEDYLLKVDSVDYITMENGEKRKRLFLQCFENDYRYTIWIEGIGGLTGMDNNVGGACIVGQNTNLLCYHKGGDLVYLGGSEEGCWFNGVEGIYENNLIIAPNPAKIEIRIQTEGILEYVRVFNTSGELLLMFNDNAINISDLIPGFYLAEIKIDGKIHMRKFMKL